MKAKTILMIYNHLPKIIKNNPNINNYLMKLAEKQIVKIKKELIQKKWQLIQLQNESSVFLR